jgi:hypothetical protein
MIADTHLHTQTAIVAQVEYEEAYDSAKFALEEALPNASQEVIGELLVSLVDLVLCSFKNQIAIAESGDKNESSSH